MVRGGLPGDRPDGPPLTTTLDDTEAERLWMMIEDVEIKCCKDDCPKIATWLILARCGGCQEVLDAPNCDEHKTDLLDLIALVVITSACCGRLVTLVSVERI